MKNKDRKGGTLEPVWSGPYTVSKVLSKGLYKLSNKGGTELKKSVNSARLKIYHEPLNKEPSEVELTKADKHDSRQDFDLILRNGKLDDNVVNRAQRILREQFKNISGWQDTVLSQTSFVPVNEECIQIHHTGHDHWVCSTSIGGFVQLYDSIPCKQLTSSMKVQLSQCYHTLVKNNLLEVELPPRQIQRGGVDCGVFAIAFACELAAGNTNPSHVTYDQSKMRQHLLTSLQKGSFEPFPRADPKSSVPFEEQYNHCEIELFCHCLLPECWADMIQCELCENWFHMICEHVGNEPEGEWLCRGCEPPLPSTKRFKR